MILIKKHFFSLIAFKLYSLVLFLFILFTSTQIKAQENSQTDVIGTIFLKSFTPPLYKKSSNYGPDGIYSFSYIKDSIVLRLNLKSIEININEGVIVDVQVIATDTSATFMNNILVFEAKQGFAALSNRYFYPKKIELTSGDSKDKYYLLLGDIIFYTRKIDQNFLPDDKIITLNKNHRSSSLTANVDLNSNIEAKVYSDLLGLFNQSTNGIIQTEISSRISSNPKPIGNFFLNSYIEPYFKYARFDNENNQVIIQDTAAIHTITKKELLKMNQQSFINLGTRINYFKIKTPSSFTETNIGAEYNFVNIKPKNQQETVIGNLITLYVEEQFNVLKRKNFGFNGLIDLMYQWAQSPQIDLSSNRATYARFCFYVFYNPKDDPSNRVFLRFQTISTIDKKMSFPMLQFGYSTKLSAKQISHPSSQLRTVQ